jgi:hypothetical protein
VAEGEKETTFNTTMLNGPSSSERGTSLGCEWKKQPPNMEGRCYYTE